VVLNYCNILMQESVVSGVWSDFIPFVYVFCVRVHAYVCVIILTPLFIGMCKVSIIITPYMQCILHTGFWIPPSPIC